MASQPEKSRNRPLLLAAAIALLLLFSVLMIRERSLARPLVHHSEAAPIVVSENDDCVCPCPTNKDVAQPPSVAATPKPEPKATAEFNLIDSANADPPTSGAFLIEPGSAPFAGIDMRRILIARQSDALSPETKSNLLARIKHLTAKRAELHKLEFVFDTSDQTLNGTPAFINPTNGLLDLTDEVLKELSQ